MTKPGKVESGSASVQVTQRNSCSEKGVALLELAAGIALIGIATWFVQRALPLKGRVHPVDVKAFRIQVGTAALFGLFGLYCTARAIVSLVSGCCEKEKPKPAAAVPEDGVQPPPAEAPQVVAGPAVPTVQDEDEQKGQEPPIDDQPLGVQDPSRPPFPPAQEELAKDVPDQPPQAASAATKAQIPTHRRSVAVTQVVIDDGKAIENAAMENFYAQIEKVDFNDPRKGLNDVQNFVLGTDINALSFLSFIKNRNNNEVTLKQCVVLVQLIHKRVEEINAQKGLENLILIHTMHLFKFFPQVLCELLFIALWSSPSLLARIRKNERLRPDYEAEIPDGANNKIRVKSRKWLSEKLLEVVKNEGNRKIIALIAPVTFEQVVKDLEAEKNNTFTLKRFLN